jgi:hypothetical protein
VDIAQITAFAFGTGALLLVSSLIVSLVILAVQFGSSSPWRALSTARKTLPEAQADAAPATGP